MLRAIRNNWHKSKAAVLVETAFEKSPLPFIHPAGTHKFANSLVEDLWSEMGGALDGSVLPRPHPISIAMAALANGLTIHRRSVVASNLCMMALTTAVAHIRMNRYHYSLNGYDLTLIEGAEDDLSLALAQEDAGASAMEDGQSDGFARRGSQYTDIELTQRRNELQQRLANFSQR